MLRQNGLALGGSLDNAIVLGETGVLNNALRFEDEFVRHKILDAVGDLALVGYPVIGHLVAHRAGHALHTEFAAKILEETNAWRLVEATADAAALPLADPSRARAAARELAAPGPRTHRLHTRAHRARVYDSRFDRGIRAVKESANEASTAVGGDDGGDFPFAAHAQGKPDFSGTWTLDTAKSDPAPQGRGGGGAAPRR